VANYPGLHVAECDGTDPLASYTVLKSARGILPGAKGAFAGARARHASLLAFSSGRRKTYKTARQIEEDAHRDPIPKFGLFLVRERIVEEKELEKLEADVDTKSGGDGQSPSCRAAPEGMFTRKRLFAGLDATSPRFEAVPQFSGEPRTMVECVSATLADEMARDERVCSVRQDVADNSHEDDLKHVKGKGGVFKATVDLQTALRSARVFNAPIAEACIVGSAIGMAARGLKPVAEIQFFDYIWPAMMQLRNELPVIRWRSNGAFKKRQR